MSVDLGSLTESFQVTGLRFVRVCSMKRMSIDLFLLDALSSQCLELETLEIINCSTPSNMRFSGGKLKKFRLANCRNLREIILEALSLIAIHYTGHLLAFNFEKCLKLVDIMLDLKPTRWVAFEFNHNLLDKLMSSLSKIEVMTTTSRLLELASRTTPVGYGGGSPARSGAVFGVAWLSRSFSRRSVESMVVIRWLLVSPEEASSAAPCSL
ncbi:hypothetical protein LINPERPRIM_LOCUS21615 [Linum perenne]